VTIEYLSVRKVFDGEAKARARKSFYVLLSVSIIVFTAACSRTTRQIPQTGPRPPASSSDHQTLQGRVVRIADGDTVTLLDDTNVQNRIRLQGIDAPETHQAFGAKSKQSLSSMIFDKDVTADCGKTDQYARLVCKILLNGQDINLEQIKAGMAWHYKEYERQQSPEDRELYARAEDEARAAHRGLWTDPNPTEPSEFRREERRARETR